MNNVKGSLNQFSKFISDETLATDLELLRRPNQKSKQIETDDHMKMANFSQGAVEFLEKFDKRKYNQLIELSNIKA